MKSQQCWRCAGVSLLVLMSAGTLASDETAPPPARRVLSVSQGKASASVLAAIQQLVSGAYRSAGREVQYLSYPVRRGLMELDAGRLDADLGRYGADLERSYRHIRVVEHPVLYLEVALYMRAPPAAINNIDSWEKLRATGLRVGAVCGSPFLESRLSAAKIDCAATSEAALKMLLNQRFDVLVDTRLTVWETLADMPVDPDMPAIEVCETAVLSNEGIYHYVHEKHAALIPMLSRFFAQAQKSGLTDRLVREAIESARNRLRARANVIVHQPGAST